MLKYKLTKYADDYDLCEIFQSLNIKFSMVNNKGVQICAPHKCRDFLGDIIWSKKTGKKVSIYGFNYNHKTAPKDETVTRLSMKFPSLVTRKTFIKNMKVFNERLTSFGAEPCKIMTAGTHTLVVEGDKCWQSVSWKMSFYTFYLKVMAYKSVDELKDPEDIYWEKLQKNPEVEALFWKNINNPYEYISGNIGEQHNNTGFFSIMSVYAKGCLNEEILGGLTV